MDATGRSLVCSIPNNLENRLDPSPRAWVDMSTVAVPELATGTVLNQTAFLLHNVHLRPFPRSGAAEYEASLGDLLSRPLDAENEIWNMSFPCHLTRYTLAFVLREMPETIGQMVLGLFFFSCGLVIQSPDKVLRR